METNPDRVMEINPDRLAHIQAIASDIHRSLVPHLEEADIETNKAIFFAMEMMMCQLIFEMVPEKSVEKQLAITLHNIRAGIGNTRDRQNRQKRCS